MKRVHLIISGDVQGIGFRAWAKEAARKLDLIGWVRNRDDGAVELVAEGSEANLNEFIALCHKGPEVAWVTDVKTEWGKATGEFINFEIRFS